MTRILVVCTANQCRSALGGALLEQHLQRRGIRAVVESAGTRAYADTPATPSTVSAGAALGVDLGRHRSQPLEHDLTDAADLIVTMERAHVREIVVARPDAFARTFTLKELVRRGSAVGPRGVDQSLPAWLARAHAGRQPAELLGSSLDDDVEDPTTLQLVDHRSIAGEIDDLTARIVELAWPTAT